ncbi:MULTISPECIES: hypothetical protein [Franconibacter]
MSGESKLPPLNIDIDGESTREIYHHDF